MANTSLRFRLVGGPKLVAAVKQKGPRVVQVLMTRLNVLMEQLAAYIAEKKLSGQVLKVQTGKLRGSVQPTPVTLSGSTITGGGVIAGGGPAFYGAIHEMGGTSPYQIMAVNARALRFVMNGQVVFAKSVMHPPAQQRAFMAPSLSENKLRIATDLNKAIQKVVDEE